MPTMSRFEAAFCRSAPWRFVARRMVLPWALQDTRPGGDVLEIGAGGGAMAAELLATNPDIRMTVTDFDATMVSAAESASPPSRTGPPRARPMQPRCRSATTVSISCSAGSCCITPSSGRRRSPKRSG